MGAAVGPYSHHGFQTFDLDQPRPMFVGVEVTIAPDHARVTGLHTMAGAAGPGCHSITGLHAMAGAADPGCHRVVTCGEPYETQGIATIDLRTTGHVPPTIVGKHPASRSPSRVARRRESHRGRPGHSRRVARSASRGDPDPDEGEPARGRLTLRPPHGDIYTFALDGYRPAVAA